MASPINRRGLIAGGLSGLAELQAGTLIKPCMGKPALPFGDAFLMRALENAPWVRSENASAVPIYVIWAPWYNFCHELVRDVNAGWGGELDFRWIGAHPRKQTEREFIATVARSGRFDLLSKWIGKEWIGANLPKEYVDRVSTSELILLSLQEIKGARGGFPVFIYYDGKELRSEFGYSRLGGKGFERLASAQPYPSKQRPDLQYLSVRWTDLGPASGLLPKSSTDYVIFSLPSLLSVPLFRVGAGKTVGAVATQRIGIGAEEWVKTGHLIRVGDRSYAGYIRVK